MTKSKAKEFAKELSELVKKYNADLYMYNSDLTAELALGDVDGEVTLIRLGESKNGFVDTGDIIGFLE